MPAGMCDTSSAVADWREDSTRLSVAKMPSKRTTIIGSFQHLAIAMDRFINFIMFLETTIFIVHVMINHDEPWRRGRDSNPRGGLRPPIDLANRPLQPLGYLSVGGSNFNILTDYSKLGSTY